jgi:succinate dehydrogenase / fumarate reductase cytochrome b subunit
MIGVPMKQKRPRNIGIMSIIGYRFPLAAIASILHRISGIILFLFIPYILWMLHLSLSSEMSFLMVKDFLASPIVAFFAWITLSALFYHLVAGVKHLMMDVGFFEEKRSGRIASLVVMVLGVIGILGIGVWILC